MKLKRKPAASAPVARPGAVHTELRLRLIAFLCSLAFLCVMDLSYQLVFSNVYYYALLAPRVDLFKVVESMVMLWLVCLAVPVRRDRISTLLTWLLILIAYVPQLTIYAMRSEDRLFMWATTGFWLAVALLVRFGPHVSLPRPSGQLAAGMRPVFAVYVLLLAIAALVVLQNGGAGAILRDFISTRVDLSGAYANRDVFASSHLPLNGYYFHWLALVFNPALFAIAIFRRQWLPALAILFAQLVIASFVGMRSYFFALFFAALVGWAFGRREPLRVLAVGIGLAPVIGLLFYYVTGDPIVYLFFTGRFLLDAGELNFAYHWFFTLNGPIPLAYLVKFYLHLPYPGHYPFAQDPAVALSLAYFHQSLAAVGGLVADAYMNFGMAGLAIWAVAVALIAKVLDAAGEGVDPQIAGAMLAMPILAMCDTYLVRVIFTTGLIWAVPLLWLLPRRPLAAREAPAREPVAPQRRSSTATSI